MSEIFLVFISHQIYQITHFRPASSASSTAPTEADTMQTERASPQSRYKNFLLTKLNFDIRGGCNLWTFGNHLDHTNIKSTEIKLCEDLTCF